MGSTLRGIFELALAEARVRISAQPDLNYRVFYLDSFIETFTDYGDSDPRLMERFLVLQEKLQFVRAGNRGSNLQRTCGAHKHDIGRQNKGARDGYRIIYYPHIPGEVHFLAMFAKSDQVNLTT